MKINTIFITAIVITENVPIDVSHIPEDLIKLLHDIGQNTFAIHCFRVM